MFTKIRNRVEGDEGFTLIELLVVILIIGILAAIAIPSFLNQREKGQDACAKSMARTMQTAMETFYVDTNAYTGANAAALTAVEDQIKDGACGTGTTVVAGAAAAGGVCAGAAGADNYCVSADSAATSPTRHSFAVHRSALGVITRRCTPAGKGGCLALGGGTW